MTAPSEQAVTKNFSPSVSLFPSIYDTYLCHELSNISPLPEPDLLDIYDKRLRILQSSAGYFAKRDRFRDVERLQLETARVYMENEEWANAIRVLKPLWQTLSWRQGGWWQLVEEVNLALRDCARKIGDGETLIAVEWELLSNCFTANLDSLYDLSRCLEDLGSLSKRPKAVVEVEKVKSCLSATFGFAAPEGIMGEKLLLQLVITSRAQGLSAPIALRYIKLNFEGSLRTIRIDCGGEELPEYSRDDGLVQLYNVHLQHDPASSGESSSVISSVRQPSRFLAGTSDLTFPPGVTRIFSFENIPREPGEIEIVSHIMYIEEESFEFEVVTTSRDHLRQHDTWIKNHGGLLKKKAATKSSLIVKILPRPPRMRIDVENSKKFHLADGLVNFAIKITNNEEAEAQVVLQAHLVDHPGALPNLKWTLEGETDNVSEQGTKDERLNQSHEKPLSISLGRLNPKGVRNATLSFQAGPEAADYVLRIDALYHLTTDPDTPISKTFEVDLVIERPFEANFVFSPRLHQSPWPSYFSADDDRSSDIATVDATLARGLKQNWFLTAKISSIAMEALRIEDVRLKILDIPNEAICTVSQPVEAKEDGGDFIPENIHRQQFDLEVQKYSLEDSRSTKLNFQLEIDWRHQSEQTNFNVTRIPIPDLIIPFGEPRVLALAHVQPGKNAPIYLDYTIENPSMYVLTFNLSMETSDEFAFSGPKTTSIQLVPLSRHTVRYTIFSFVHGTWITPLFRVVDPYFSKTLKIQATEGFRSDSDGLHIWVDAED